MYEAYYGLVEKPFTILPDPDMIYWSQHHRLAYAMLEYGVLNQAGFTVITGDVGSGKTTLVRRLMRRLDDSFTIGFVSNTGAHSRELLRWVMLALDQPYEHASYLDVFNSFQHFVVQEYNHGRRTLLIIDEAQNMAVDALEELRMLSNINADKHQLVQLILVGQPQLKSLLQRPELEQFAQRISSDFHLRPLPQHEVAEYVNFRLECAGARDPIFQPEAIALIGRASGGIPRKINILCDAALVYGFASDSRQIGSGIVDAVLEDKREFGVFSTA